MQCTIPFRSCWGGELDRWRGKHTITSNMIQRNVHLWRNRSGFNLLREIECLFNFEFKQKKPQYQFGRKLIWSAHWSFCQNIHGIFYARFGNTLHLSSWDGGNLATWSPSKTTTTAHLEHRATRERPQPLEHPGAVVRAKRLVEAEPEEPQLGRNQTQTEQNANSWFFLVLRCSVEVVSCLPSSAFCVPPPTRREVFTWQLR